MHPNAVKLSKSPLHNLLERRCIPKLCSCLAAKCWRHKTATISRACGHLDWLHFTLRLCSYQFPSLRLREMVVPCNHLSPWCCLSQRQPRQTENVWLSVLLPVHNNISQGGTVGSQNAKSSPQDHQDTGEEKEKHSPPKVHCQGGSAGCCRCWEKIRCLQKPSWQGRHQMQNKRSLCIQPLPWRCGWPSPEKLCWARPCPCKQVAFCLCQKSFSCTIKHFYPSVWADRHEFGVPTGQMGKKGLQKIPLAFQGKGLPARVLPVGSLLPLHLGE